MSTSTTDRGRARECAYACVCMCMCLCICACVGLRSGLGTGHQEKKKYRLAMRRQWSTDLQASYWPFEAAPCKGVHASQSVMLMSPPASRRRHMRSVRLSMAAWWRGLRPSWFPTFGFAPCCRSSFTSSTSPAVVAASSATSGWKRTFLLSVLPARAIELMSWRACVQVGG